MRYGVNCLFAFLAGATEFRSSFTRNYGDDIGLLESYDRGRECMHRLTLRHFDS